MKRNIIGALTILCCTFTAPFTYGSALELAIPRAYETTEGGGGSSLLFHDIRLQNVYSSSLFPSNKVLVIRELRFRPSAIFGGAFSSTIADLQINLSTTDAAVGGLSATFADNVGADDTVVFNGSVDVSSTFSGPAGGPKAFDIIIPLTTPFRYDPAEGNLLIDYRNRSGSTATLIDAGVNNGASRAFALGADSTVAQSVDQGPKWCKWSQRRWGGGGGGGGGNRQDDLVIPTHYTTTEGLGGSSVLIHDIRLQNVYSSAQFSSANAVIIRELRFRPSAIFGSAFSATVADLQINLSTTDKAVDGLSATFADNVGADDTVVFNGSVDLSSAFTGPAGGPKEFDIVIPLSTPFRYEPAQGNLLIDYRNRSGSTATFIDAGVNNGASRAFALGANSTVAQSVDQGAEVVQLVGTVVSGGGGGGGGNGGGNGHRSIVISPAYANTEGGGGSSLLFHDIRLQNVYSSTLFPNNKVLKIRELRFRPSAFFGGAFSATVADLQINLSATQAAVDGLSATFADNVGANDTVVFNGSVNLSSAFAGPASGPKAFDIVIRLDKSFRYDPSQGNLLIDYRNRSGSTATLIDAGVNNGVSRAFALGANSTAAQSVDQGAEVVQLLYSEVGGDGEGTITINGP
jgi:hypothetical protein